MLYAAATFIGVIILWRYMPETKGKGISLEAIEEQYVHDVTLRELGVANTTSS